MTNSGPFDPPPEPTPERSQLDELPPPQWPAPEAADSGYLPDSNWKYGDAALALLVGIIVGPFLAILLITIFSGTAAAEDAPPLALLSVQAVASIAAVATLSWFRGTRSWKRDFGFTFHAKHIWGIAAGMALQIAVAILTVPLIERFAEDDRPQQEIARVAESLTGAQIALFALLVAVLAPIFEEIVYRGMLLPRLVRSLGRHRAVLITSGLFAATHLLDPNAILVVPGLFVVGMVLGYLALHAGNIGLPIFVHMGTNGLAVLFLAYSDEIEKLADTVESFITGFF